MKAQGALAKRRRRSTAIAAAVFLLPAILILIVFIGYPIVSTFITSTVKWNGLAETKPFVGLDNWKRLVSDKNFWQAFRNNIVVMLLSLTFQVPFALALATFLDIHGKKANFFKVVWFLPYLMSPVAIGILFKYVLDANYGFFASLSKALGGGSVDFLGNQEVALFAVIGVICWQYIPFYMLYYLAAYGNIPTDLFEASAIDGAGRWRYFWSIALPCLKPTIISGATLSIIGSLKYFDLIFVMTGGGPGVATELMATYMYKTSFVSRNMGYGAALAGGMFILITLMALITITLLNRLGGDDI
ncbi:MAG: sugar ABC transporter permease [Clostridia bacterium]|nr:sugar ABC transporter permease [Clostridia bacterium]